MDPRLYSEMINLTRATDRRDHMQAEMQRAGITADMHAAVDAQIMPEAEIYEQVSREGRWGYVHLAAAACSLSHQLVWQRFLNSGKSHCLVLEDDVHMSAELGQWTANLDWWPQDADIVKLERWRGRTLKILLDVNGARHLNRRIARLYNRHVGAAGYMLTRSAAKALVSHRPMPLVVDNYLFNQNTSSTARRLMIYQIQPALVTQGNEPVGWVQSPVADYRPKGAMLVRQKLKRAYYELAYPLSTWIKLITGRAKLQPALYAAHALNTADSGLAASSPSIHLALNQPKT